MSIDSQTRRQHADSIADSILASVLDPTVTIDSKGIVQSASDSVLEVFGWEPQELVGQNIKVLMPAEPHGQLHDDYLARYRATGETHILGRTRRFEVQRKDGERIACDLSVSRVDMEGSDEPLFTGSFRDITARERAEEALRASERRFHAAFDQEYQFVGLLDTEGTIVEVNQAALHAIGASADEVCGQPFEQTGWWSHSPQARSDVRAAIERAARGEFVRFQVEVRCHDGTRRVIDFSIKPVTDDEGNVEYLMPEGRDMTDVQRAQEAETAMLRSLAAIGESAAILAHEIKSPLTAINVALRAVANKLGTDERDTLEDLAGRLKQLDAMMQRTLTFAKPLEFERETLYIDKLLRAVERDASAVGTKIEVRDRAPGATVVGSPALLGEVLSNFVRNAAEAILDEGRIVLSAWSDAQHVVLSVEDNGPGVSPRVVDSLFRPFVTTKQKGTGLGLAISRKIVEAHGGRIEAGESVLGGARLSVYLPPPQDSP